MGDGLAARVECYSGSAYAERPIAIHWEGARLEVDRVVAQWRVPGGKQFRVQTRDGQFFLLWYDEQHDTWRIKAA